MKKSILAKIFDLVSDSSITTVIIGIGIFVLLYVFVAAPLTALRFAVLRFVLEVLSKMKIPI